MNQERTSTRLLISIEKELNRNLSDKEKEVIGEYLKYAYSVGYDEYALRVSNDFEQFFSGLKRREVGQYDLAGNWIKPHDSIYQAAEAMNTYQSRMYAAIIRNRPLRGYKFKFI